MKKLGSLTFAIWALSLFLIPVNGFADLVEMSDQELHKVTGQAGLILQADDIVNFNVQGETFSFGDPNGPNMSLVDTTLRGSVSTGSGIEMSFDTHRTNDGTIVQGLNINARDVTVEIDEFSTDIRLGQGSLGKVYMQGFRAHISGNVRVYTRGN